MNEFVFFSLYGLTYQNLTFDKFVYFTAEVLPYFVIIFAFFYVLLHNDNMKSINPFQALKQKWKEVVLVFFSGIFAWILAHFLKNIFVSLRPFLALPNVTPLWVEGGYAFPSGHATFFMALAVAIYLNHKKTGLVFVLFALLIGIARIIAGVHYPVDVLGGFVLGAGISYLIKSRL